jgi:hypothetical protein
LSKRRGRREFHTLFGRLEDDRQKSFTYFGISVHNLKLETVVSHKQSKEEYRVEM